MKESELQSKILSDLNSREDVWCVKIIQANKSGTPDILGCYRGDFFAIELKSEKGKLSKLQHKQCNDIRKCQGFFYAIYDWTDYQFFTRIMGMHK